MSDHDDRTGFKVDKDLEAARLILEPHIKPWQYMVNRLRGLIPYEKYARLIEALAAALKTARDDQDKYWNQTIEDLTTHIMMLEAKLKSVEVSDEDLAKGFLYYIQFGKLELRLDKAYETGFRKACELRAIGCWPSADEIKEARIKWATNIYEGYTDKSKEAERQISVLGCVPWDAACEWLREKLCGERSVAE